MPPHCDSMDGPVVLAARRAIEQGNVDLVLPYVHREGEDEVRQEFDQVMAARKAGGAARKVADLHFFETAVRVHRAGEHAPYTGLKPAGLDVGPVIPLAEEAIESGDAGPLTELLTSAVRDEILRRFRRMQRLKRNVDGSLADARKYVEAMLGFEVYTNSLYGCIRSGPHGGHAD